MTDLLGLNPNGRATYATTIETYSPVFLDSTPGDWADARNALGSPDYANKQNFTSLGLGGSLVLGFGDGALTGSGTSAPDLVIAEIGPDVEDTLAWISPDGRVWSSIGRVAGGTTGVDIDAFGFGVNDAFSYLRLQDVADQGLRDGLTVGADIDSVAVVNSVAAPEPSALILLGTGLAAIAARRKWRARKA